VNVLERLAATAELYILMSIYGSRSKEAMVVVEDRLREIRGKGVLVQIQVAVDGEEQFESESVWD
jgi:hypothetical protein